MGTSLARDRTITMYAMVGTDIDPTAADDLTITGNFLGLSNLAQATDAIYEIDPMAVFEGDGFDINGGCIVPPLTVRTETSFGETNYSVWSSAISDGSGNLSTAVDLTFDGNEHHSAITFYFGDCYPVNMTVGWYLNGSVVKTVSITGNSSPNISPMENGVPVALTYDRIVLNVVKVSQANMHLKLIEIEFGSSYTIGSDYITGSTKLIYSHDPMGLTQSPNELDLTYSNIGGTFDEDNPNQLYSHFNLKNTIDLIFEVTTQGRRYTYLMGKFFISDRYVSGNRFCVTALDCRSLLQNVYPMVTFDISTSIGEKIRTILESIDMHLYDIDEGLFDIYPDTAVSFDGRTDMLTIIQYAVQYAAMDMWVPMNGYLHIGTGSSTSYGSVSNDDMYSFPSVESLTADNVVQVTYGGMVYEEDRSNGDPRVVVAVDNPFITTQLKAQTVAERIADGFVVSSKRTKWRGDLELNAGDTVQMETRFTSESIPTMTVTELQFEYSGSVKCDMTAVSLRTVS